MVGIALAVAVAVVGLSATVVCAMPPECPMGQAVASPACCNVPSPGGVPQAPCRLQPVAATAAGPSLPGVVRATAHLMVVGLAIPPSVNVQIVSDTPAIPAAVPRFLLTHTFRL